MNVTLENYRSLDFDTISVKEEWNIPAERERRMHSIHVEKPRDFDPFGHAGFAHLWLQYD